MRTELLVLAALSTLAIACDDLPHEPALQAVTQATVMPTPTQTPTPIPTPTAAPTPTPTPIPTPTETPTPTPSLSGLGISLSDFEKAFPELTFTYLAGVWQASLPRSEIDLTLVSKGDSDKVSQVTLTREILGDELSSARFLSTEIFLEAALPFLDLMVPGWQDEELGRWVVDNAVTVGYHETRVGTVDVFVSRSKLQPGWPTRLSLRIQPTTPHVRISEFTRMFPTLTFDRTPEDIIGVGSKSDTNYTVRVEGREQALQKATLEVRPGMPEATITRVLSSFLDATVPGWKEAGLVEWLADTHALGRELVTTVGNVRVTLWLSLALGTEELTVEVLNGAS